MDAHPIHVATDQIAEAANYLDRHPDLSVRWPFPDLDNLTGPMNGGEVWFVCAISAGGKTTFVTSTIERWWQSGRKLYVMPLETRPRAFRTYLACMACGVHPGDALSGNLRKMPDGDAKREAIKGALYEQAHEPFLSRVMISEQRAINVAGLRAGLEEALDFGASVVIVDHIDHVAGGEGSNLFAESKAVNDAALRMAQDSDLLLVFTSQLNLQVSRTPDHLSKYQPPRVHDVFLPSIKLQNATGMIGLFRKIRERNAHETPDEYMEKLKQARKGEIAPTEVLDRHVIGVNAMKLRHYGSKDGERVFLGFENGRVVPLAEKDRWTTTAGYPRPQV